MKNIWMVIICMSCLLLGFTLGTGIGMQKGQYMLFEGLNQVFDGAEINIDLNETQLIDGFKEAAVELIDRKELEWAEWDMKNWEYINLTNETDDVSLGAAE